MKQAIETAGKFVRNTLIIFGVAGISFMGGMAVTTKVSMPINIQFGGGAEAAEADYNAKIKVITEAMPTKATQPVVVIPARKPVQQ